MTRVHANILPWLLLHQYLESLRNRPEPQWLAQSDTLTFSSGCQNLTKYRYNAWGQVLGVYDGSGTPLTESAIGNRILWQGREYSWKTGIYYFRARWYDPITGRWLSNDPIGISGGLNQYVFCSNNPVNFRDPYGLLSEKEREEILKEIKHAKAVIAAGGVPAEADWKGEQVELGHTYFKPNGKASSGINEGVTDNPWIIKAAERHECKHRKQWKALYDANPTRPYLMLLDDIKDPKYEVEAYQETVKALEYYLRTK